MTETNKNLWVFVDDLREIPYYWQEPTCPPDEIATGEIIVLRTFDEAYAFIEENWNQITRVSLDHDLGEESTQKTGYEIACLIEELVFTTNHVPEVMISHSANPVGWNKIMNTFTTIRRRAEKE